MIIAKVVIPAAGLGTRFLPITKAVPKELLPILEKPAIHYVVQEAVMSAATDVCLIVSQEKEAIKHYFSPSSAAMQVCIEKKNLTKKYAEVDALIAETSFTYVLQDEPRGLGHAVSLARDFVGDQFFAVMLPDDIIASSVPVLAQLCTVACQQNATVIAVMRVPRNELSSYGVIAVKNQLSDRLFEVAHLVEKPKADEAPSDFAIVGRYILSPAIFYSLATIKPQALGELQLTDAIAHLLASGQPVFAYLFEGERFDTGTPDGWLKTNIYFAAHR